MKQEERASIIRIVSDLIQADGILDTREIDFLDDLRDKYGITKEDEILAESLSLAKALKVIAATEENIKHSLMNAFHRITMSDYYCAKEEALLLIALRLVLTLNTLYEASVLSFDSSVLSFENSQILYLESEFDEKTNKLMKQFYREICSEIRLSGFELVYLPKVSEHYGCIAETDFLRIAEFLYPKVSEERLSSIIKQMQNLSTSSFCNEQLATKLSMKELRTIHPSFLIKIGESAIGERRNANFLLVEIADSPLDTIRYVMDLFAEYYHNLQINYIQEAKGRFILTGYYRLIFE